MRTVLHRLWYDISIMPDWLHRNRSRAKHMEFIQIWPVVGPQEGRFFVTIKTLIQDVPNPKTWMFLVSSFRCFCPMHWGQVLSRKLKCSWSSTDWRCSKYIWVINKFIAHQGGLFIIGLTKYIKVGEVLRSKMNILRPNINPNILKNKFKKYE